MNFKSEIQKLVTNFKNEKAWNRSEEHIQTMFTIKLLDLLDYNSANIRINQGQEVKTGKKPDILLFSDSGNTIMVIESKDASKVDMLDGRYQSKTFVEQLNGYCKAEGINWGILTNFVEWRIYSVYQNRLYKEKKYAFHELLWQGAKKDNYIDLLSDQGIKFFESLTKKTLISAKGKIDDDPVYYPQQEEIKEKFFQDLKKWRSNLRSYISKNYSSKYDIDLIDLMTQKLLDRLIFIDYCSDNNIISQDRLHAILHSKDDIHKELQKIFDDMDEKFNSELFSHNECDVLKIPDEIIKPIIIELSSIDFSKLSVHIIGEVYENYLGELLKAVKNKVSIDESKSSQKRKSQGIYYTPDFIVNYIVENTVGTILLKCKTIEEIEKIKVLDPACGSGSFLIRVFDEFIKHYERIDPSGLFHFDRNKKILQNNIYGVDLDEKAVEIAKLNLLIKALEGSAHFDLKGKKLLPNLKLNIRCGNSLVSGEGTPVEMGLFYKEFVDDIHKLKQLRLNFNKKQDDLDKDKIYNDIQVFEYTLNSNLNNGLEKQFSNFEEIKPLNYTIAFPDVFAEGGFDCIVGNPPYIFTRELITKNQKDYYNAIYTQTEFKLNTYILFSERATKLVKENGYWGYILPNNWLSIETARNFRTFILNSSSSLSIVNCKDKVFDSASVDTTIIISQKSGDKRKSKVNLFELSNNIILKKNEISIQSLLKTENRIFDFSTNDNTNDILSKITSCSKPLGDISNVKNGVQAYTVGEGVPKQTKKMKEERIYHSTNKIDDNWIKYVDGVDVARYSLGWSGQFIKYGKNLSRSRTPDLFIGERILVRQIPNKPPYCIHAMYTNSHIINDNNSMIINCSNEYSIFYILGLLNSKLISYWFEHNFGKLQRKIFPQFKIKELRIFPIAIIEKNDSRYIKLIEKVKERIKISSNSKEDIKKQALDREIDNMVYEIYGLTENDLNS